MKNAKTKSILVILGTLLIGMVLGGLIAGRIIHGRIHSFMNMRTPEGFQREVMAAADPSPDQRRALEPILFAFANRMDEMHSRHMEELQENMSLLEMSLQEILNPAQMENVKAKLRRMEGRGHHGHHRPHGAGDSEDFHPHHP